MKRAPLLLFAGTVAGFISVFGLHTARPRRDRGGRRHVRRYPRREPGVRRATTPAGPGGGSTRSALGPEEQFGYGVLDVKVTVSGTRITDVSVPLLQAVDPTSQQICDQVFPMLRSEVLSAQTATINGVSGATYTSASYAQSLQSALDKLHAR